MSEHELKIERLMDVPVSALWEAYLNNLNEWFCPKPWRAEVEVMDLRAGGRALITMYGPDGEVVPNDGIYLEVIPEKRIVFTDALTEGFKPAGPFMVGIFEFEPQPSEVGDKTLFRGIARHWTAEARQQHEAMGFEAGWGEMARQWEEVAQRIAGKVPA